MAGRYAPGASLWRVRVTHFTPWDCNWPYGLPSGAQSPPAIAPGNLSDAADIASLDIPIEGTPYNLHYASDRMAGGQFTRSLEIPLSGAVIPDSLLRIELRVEVAGQLHQQSFSPLPNQTYLFTWDGKDGYGRAVNGARRATVNIDYVYDLVYYAASGEFSQSFAQIGDATFIGQRNTSTARLSRGYELVLENYRNKEGRKGSHAKGPCLRTGNAAVGVTLGRGARREHALRRKLKIRRSGVPDRSVTFLLGFRVTRLPTLRPKLH
jgi:hypothetical protein